MRNIKTTHVRINQAKQKATLKIDRLNLGNNFTWDHFIEAISSRLDESEKLCECIEKLNTGIHYNGEVEIIANGNYGLVKDTFVIAEFFDCLNDERI
jgi:hypothetical protein